MLQLLSPSSYWLAGMIPKVLTLLLLWSVIYCQTITSISLASSVITSSLPSAFLTASSTIEVSVPYPNTTATSLFPPFKAASANASILSRTGSIPIASSSNLSALTTRGTSIIHYGNISSAGSNNCSFAPSRITEGGNSSFL